jgi:DNA end-binding protein Ku
LALQLIEHISEDRFDPTEFVDEERQRILAAVEKKIAGQQIVAPTHVETPSADVIDLMAALRASLTEAGALKSSKQTSAQPGKSSRRKPPRRAANSVEAIARKSVGAKK